MLEEPNSVGDQCEDLPGGGHTSETQPCNEQACPTPSPTPSPSPAPTAVDCVLWEWQNDGDCSVTCGTGVQNRVRQILIEPTTDGLQCGPLTDTVPCDTGVVCPVDCEMSPWGEWSECTCGADEIKRTREVAQEPIGDGIKCKDLPGGDSTKEKQSCNAEGCPTAEPTTSPTIETIQWGQYYPDGKCKNIEVNDDYIVSDLEAAFALPGEYIQITEPWNANAKALCDENRNIYQKVLPAGTEDGEGEHAVLCHIKMSEDALYVMYAGEIYGQFDGSCENVSWPFSLDGGCQNVCSTTCAGNTLEATKVTPCGEAPPEESPTPSPTEDCGTKAWYDNQVQTVAAGRINCKAVGGIWESINGSHDNGACRPTQYKSNGKTSKKSCKHFDLDICDCLPGCKVKFKDGEFLRCKSKFQYREELHGPGL